MEWLLAQRFVGAAETITKQILSTDSRTLLLPCSHAHYQFTPLLCVAAKRTDRLQKEKLTPGCKMHGTPSWRQMAKGWQPRREPPPVCSSTWTWRSPTGFVEGKVLNVQLKARQERQLVKWRVRKDWDWQCQNQKPKF